MGLKTDPFAFPDPSFDPPASGERSIVLGGGCFWCTEAVYTQLKGVRGVVPGYAGDGKASANYDAVCSGRTNHAEVIRVSYDAAQISLGQILKLFFSIAHDPTQKDGQGADIGRQYRSVIFYQDDAQKQVAEAYMAQIAAAKLFDAPLATELSKLDTFYEAEAYHHDYAARNPNQGYIRGVSDPKVKKLKAAYPGLLKG
ncbi:MAG TPA: peptide-methionine (S)-S-oxide reductase MsrA [Polyangiales bacterium]|nr:peptide-methionine (S)-S-oxide reductase MsrA [Polyangiales bacterium]